MIKCPNCGSTAQVRHVFGTAYACGCGKWFYKTETGFKTASQICEEIEKMERSEK